MPESHVIEAPDFLGRNQNFYDQEPYLLIPETGMDTDQTRIFLTRISMLAKGIDANLDEQEIFEKVLRESAARLKVPRIKEDPLIEAGVTINNHLKRNPFIWKYSQTQFTPSVYRINGSVKNQTYSGLTPSYPKWGSLQEELKGRLVLVGIGEVFPGGMGAAAIPDSIIGITNPTTRRWRILSASEMTRD